jgi:hypothetical protein
MKVIHKRIIQIVDEQILVFKENDKILHVGEQRGNLCLWYTTDTNETNEQIYHISIRGTGHMLAQAHSSSHIGTVLMSDGLVWHVFGEPKWQTYGGRKDENIRKIHN